MRKCRDNTGSPVILQIAFNEDITNHFRVDQAPNQAADVITD